MSTVPQKEEDSERTGQLTDKQQKATIKQTNQKDGKNSQIYKGGELICMLTSLLHDNNIT